MSQRVFEIDELARLISRNLASTDRKSLVSLACTCRVLEVPALSSLWELQDSLSIFIGVLPTTDEEIGHDDTSNPWHRFRRYASWMHQLQLGRSDEVWAIDKTTFDRLLTGSTSRLVFPNLHRLTCDALTATNLRLIPYFLSPHLTHLTLRTHWMDRVSVDDLLPDLRHTIQAIPMQFLQELIIDLGVGLTHHFEDEVSSIIQRSGNSLRVLNTPVFLGEAVVRHVLNLKNLRVWKGVCSPPPTRVSSSSITVPPLRALVLREEAFGWIQWLTGRGRGFPDTRDGPPEQARLQETLTHLGFQGSVPLDPTFISSVFPFKNLVTLEVRSACWDTNDCSFYLTNQDVLQLADTLPQLEELDLGVQCLNDVCRTTVSCLLALSIRCKGLRNLWIHFNTKNLADDVRFLSQDPALRDLRSLPTRCPLESLCIGYLMFPPSASDDDITTIARGFIDIFPSFLETRQASFRGWDVLTSRIKKLREARTTLLAGIEA